MTSKSNVADVTKILNELFAIENPDVLQKHLDKYKSALKSTKAIDSMITQMGRKSDTRSASDARVRLNCAQALDTAGKKAKRAIPMLIDIIKNPDEDIQIRTLCVSTIGRMGKQALGVVPLLIVIGQNPDEDDGFRKVCAEALVELGYPKEFSIESSVFPPSSMDCRLI